MVYLESLQMSHSKGDNSNLLNNSSKLRFLVVNVNGVKLPRYCYDADKKGIVEGLKRFFGIGCKNDSPEDLVDHRGGIYIYEVCGVTAGFVGNCMVFVR